jgi:hypothetical protein
MAKQTLSAALAQFKDLSMNNIKYALNESVQDVMEGAQTPQPSVKVTGGSFETGKIAVDTAELINSLHLDDQHIGDNPEVVGLIEPGTIQTFEWQSDHAAAHEYGFTHTSGKEVPGRFYATENAAKFPDLVEKYAKEVSGK